MQDLYQVTKKYLFSIWPSHKINCCFNTWNFLELALYACVREDEELESRGFMKVLFRLKVILRKQIFLNMVSSPPVGNVSSDVP